jgi:LPXTG-motif cell wall-anchored protein
VRRSRVATATAFAVLATLAPVLLLSSPSQAEPQKLKVSRSAAGPWTEQLDTALFDVGGALVPQDSVTDTFYVKNDSPQAARATLSVPGGPERNDLERHLIVSAELGGVTSGMPLTGGADPDCTAHVSGPSIPARGVQKVDVTLRLDDVMGQVAQAQEADVGLVVTLSQVGPNERTDICGAQEGAEPAAGCADPSQVVLAVVGDAGCPEIKGEQTLDMAGDLPATGAPPGTAAVAGLGLACLAGGALLLVVRRRRETDQA